ARRRGRCMAARGARTTGSPAASDRSADGHGGNPPDAVGLRAVLDRLKTLGWAEGVTAHIDIRWSKSDLGLMRENAQALLAVSPDVILCHSNPALAQLRPLAGATPIVFVMVADPVGSGFVNNLAHPGGNITGFTNFEPSMGGKWVEM